MAKRIAVLTSGGDSPGMNAAIRAVTRVGMSKKCQVFGIRHGYQGLIHNEFIQLDRRVVSDTINRGGTFLGSARCPEFKEEEVQRIAYENLQNEHIDGLVVIGGDGSYRGALALSKMGIPCVGIPGTIDNDIPGTEYTIGFQTALETVVECVDRLRDTSSSHHRCSIVEVMGNRCEDIALSAAIACGAEIVVTRSTGCDLDIIVHKLNNLHFIRGKNHAIIIISEKMTDVNEMAEKITEMTQFSSRATVLGHIQRGGTPCPFDRVLASQMGQKAVDCLLEGESGVCVGIQKHQFVTIPIQEALDKKNKDSTSMLELFNELV